MLLNSAQAIQVNIAIMRAFVKLRETLAANRELAIQFEKLARKVDSHDQAIAGLIHTLRELMKPPESEKKHPIGFVAGEGTAQRRLKSKRKSDTDACIFLFSCVA